MGILSRLFGKKDKEVIPQNIDIFEKAEKVVLHRDEDETFEVETTVEIPPLQGDYAKTIFLWAHSKADTVKKNDGYARYFLYECGIRDAEKYHLDMIEAGYFSEANEIEILEAMKVADLKKILSELSMPVSGKKEVLIQRILHSSKKPLDRMYFPETMYSLTEKGKNYLRQHEDYVKIHKHNTWDIGWQEYDKRHCPGQSFYDTVWGIFNERLLSDTHHYGRHEYFCMYQLLAEEGKRKKAMEMLLRILYIDLSGVNGETTFELFKKGLSTFEDLEDHFHVAVMLAPGIVYPVAEYADVFDRSIVDKLYEWKLPVQICDKNFFLDIINSLFDGTYDEQDVEEKLKARYDAFIQAL